MEDQLGQEATPDAYVAKMVDVFREVRRVLRNDGTLWLNLGDSYATGGGERKYGSSDGGTGRGPGARRNSVPESGLKPKDLVGIPWRVAFALQADGWWLRQDIIWHKPNAMPESVTDRCTKSHEYVFLLSKSARYYYDSEAIKEATVNKNKSGRNSLLRVDRVPVPRKPNGNATVDDLADSETRNRRSVWTIASKSYQEAHFATFPPALIEPCVLAGCPAGGKMCDCNQVISTPAGSGETCDPTLITGRAGMNRIRKQGEGIRSITRLQQRWHAKEMKSSPHREAMRIACGEAFDHYIRTDKSGGRPLPEHLRLDFMARGFITEAPPCNCSDALPGIVLDPFGGSGTTGQVAKSLGRDYLLCELNPEYVAMAERRINTPLAKPKAKPARRGANDKNYLFN